MGTESVDRSPESGPPKGSQWTAEDHQLMLTISQSKKARSVDPESLWKFCNVPRNKKFEYPCYIHCNLIITRSFIARIR